jgi:hypothetical protein
MCVYTYIYIYHGKPAPCTGRPTRNMQNSTILSYTLVESIDIPTNVREAGLTETFSAFINIPTAILFLYQVEARQKVNRSVKLQRTWLCATALNDSVWSATTHDTLKIS